jgi:glycerophosphoryl diester phosphodiesterase
VQQRLPTLREEPIAFAHRGARAHAPENTIEAFQLALKLGANGLESDCWITSDGVTVLDHDGVVKFLGRKKPIAEVTAAKLPSHIPSVAEFFQQCGTDFDFSVDVKDPSSAEGLVSEARNAGFDPQRLWLCHHKLEQTLEYRVAYPDVRIVDSSRLARIKEGPEMRMATLADRGVDVLNMHITDWNGGLVTMAHRFNFFAFGWDVQFPHALTDAFRMGLDAVYSDYTDRLVDAYTEQVGHAPKRV